MMDTDIASRLVSDCRGTRWLSKRANTRPFCGPRLDILTQGIQSIVHDFVELIHVECVGNKHVMIFGPLDRVDRVKRTG
jgi:hypothetical protein